MIYIDYKYNEVLQDVCCYDVEQAISGDNKCPIYFNFPQNTEETSLL